MNTIELLGGDLGKPGDALLPQRSIVFAARYVQGGMTEPVAWIDALANATPATLESNTYYRALIDYARSLKEQAS